MSTNNDKKILTLDHIQHIKDYIDGASSTIQTVIDTNLKEHIANSIEEASTQIQSTYDEKYNSLVDRIAYVEQHGTPEEIAELQLKLDALEANTNDKQVALEALEKQLDKLSGNYTKLDEGVRSGSIFSAGQLDEIINTALISRTHITDDSVSTPSLFATEVVSLIGKFGQIKAANIIGEDIAGHTIRSNNTLADGTPVWQIGNNGEGWLAKENIKWNSNGDVTFGPGVKISFDNVEGADAKLSALLEGYDSSIADMVNDAIAANGASAVSKEELAAKLAESTEEANSKMDELSRTLNDAFNDSLGSLGTTLNATIGELNTNIDNRLMAVDTEFDRIDGDINNLSTAVTQDIDAKLQARADALETAFTTAIEALETYTVDKFNTEAADLATYKQGIETAIENAAKTGDTEALAALQAMYEELLSQIRVLENDFAKKQEAHEALKVDVQNLQASALSATDVEEVLKTSLITKTEVTADGIQTPSLMAQKIVGLVGTFGTIDASKITGTNIQGYTVSSPLDVKNVDGSPVYETDENGNTKYELAIGEDGKYIHATDAEGNKLYNPDGSAVYVHKMILNPSTNGWEPVPIKKQLELKDAAWVLKSDGSGHLGNGNISWDEDGDITFGPDVTISWGQVDGAQAKLDDAKAALTNDYRSYTDESKAALQEELNVLSAEKDRIAALQEELNVKIIATETKANESIAEAQSAILGVKSEIDASLQESLNEIRTDISGDINRLNLDFNTFTNNINSKVNGFEQSGVQSAIAAAEAKATALIQEKLSTVVTDITKNVTANTESKLLDLQQSILTNKEALALAISQGNTELVKSLEKQQAELQSEIAGVRNDYTNSTEAFSAIESSIGQMQVRIDGLGDELSGVQASIEGSVLSEEDVLNLFEASMTNATEITSDGVASPRGIFKNLVALVGTFGLIKTSKLVGDDIQGVTISAPRDTKELDPVEPYEILRDENGQKVTTTDESGKTVYVYATMLNESGEYEKIPNYLKKDLKDTAWYFDKDGSGQLANGKIKWNKDGEVTLKGVTISYEDFDADAKKAITDAGKAGIDAAADAKNTAIAAQGAATNAQNAAATAATTATNAQATATTAATTAATAAANAENAQTAANDAKNKADNAYTLAANAKSDAIKEAENLFNSKVGSKLTYIDPDGIYSGTIAGDCLVGQDIVGANFMSSKNIAGTSTPTWKINDDGDGYFASNNIHWTKNGELYVKGVMYGALGDKTSSGDVAINGDLIIKDDNSYPVTILSGDYKYDTTTNPEYSDDSSNTAPATISRNLNISSGLLKTAKLYAWTGASSNTGASWSTIYTKYKYDNCKNGLLVTDLYISQDGKYVPITFNGYAYSTTITVTDGKYSESTAAGSKYITISVNGSELKFDYWGQVTISEDHKKDVASTNIYSDGTIYTTNLIAKDGEFHGNIYGGGEFTGKLNGATGYIKNASIASSDITVNANNNFKVYKSGSSVNTIAEGEDSQSELLNISPSTELAIGTTRYYVGSTSISHKNKQNANEKYTETKKIVEFNVSAGTTINIPKMDISTSVYNPRIRDSHSTPYIQIYLKYNDADETTVVLYDSTKNGLTKTQELYRGRQWTWKHNLKETVLTASKAGRVRIYVSYAASLPDRQACDYASCSCKVNIGDSILINSTLSSKNTINIGNNGMLMYTSAGNMISTVEEGAIILKSADGKYGLKISNNGIQKWSGSGWVAASL